MLKLSRERLLERLNSYSRDALHSASELCVERGHYEVTVSHFVMAMIKQEGGDWARILPRLNIQTEELKPKFDRVLSSMRGGAQDLPQFSTLLLELLQDAMMISTGELGENDIRTGAIFAALAVTPDRYCHYFFIGDFEAIDPRSLLKGFEELSLGSMENDGTLSDGDNPSQGISNPPMSETALDRFGRNLTALAEAGEIDPVFCRDGEIGQMMDVLARRRKNNPILVGDPGVGKTALAEGLAIHLAEDDVPPALQGATLWELDMGALQAGASVKGEFERRLKAVLDEVQSSPNKIILFIDEAHTLIGGGGQAGGADAANLLKPALARGQLRAIAATTWSEYKRYFEKDAALARRFQLINLDEPSIDDCVTILRGLRNRYEDAHSVYVTDAALQAAAALSARYLTGRQLPDKALDVLDTACVRVAAAQSMRPRQLSAKLKRLEILKQLRENIVRDAKLSANDETDQLASIDAEIATVQAKCQVLEQRWSQDNERVTEIRELRTQIQQSDEPETTISDKLRDLLEACEDMSQSISYEVGPDLVADIISEWTGIPVAAMSGDDATQLLKLGDALREVIRGQDDGIAAIHDRLKTSRLDLVREGTPRGAFLLVGPSGVGKTETAEQVAHHLYGGRRFLTVINMSEYQEKHSLSRLIGSPPGYVGYGEGGILTEAIRKKPYSVVLLDEVEKAHADILNLFLQAFDKGVINDGEGREIDCQNIVFFMTSNLGADALMENSETVAKASQEALEKAIRPHLASHFKPALLSRLTVLCYKPLSSDTRLQIIDLKLNITAKRLADTRSLEFNWDDSVVDLIDNLAAHSENGARIIDQTIDKYLLSAIAEETLLRISEGQPLHAVHIRAEDGAFSLSFTSENDALEQSDDNESQNNDFDLDVGNED